MKCQAVDNHRACGQPAAQEALAAGGVVLVVDDEEFDVDEDLSLVDGFDSLAEPPLSEAGVDEELFARLSVR